MKKTGYNNLREVYIECFKFISESKKQIYFAISAFIFFILIGYFILPPKELELQLIEKLREIALAFSGLGLWQTIWLIFSNNLFVCFISIILGIIFGIFPFLVLMSNGYLIGYVAHRAVAVDGISTLWKLLPHGLFELPAILISIGLGFKLGTSLFKKDTFKKNFRKSMLVFLTVILVLLIIAAVIEGILVFLIK